MQTFTEDKRMIQWCMYTFVSDLLILCIIVEDLYILDNLYHNNKSLNSGVNNSEFKIKHANEIEDKFLAGEKGICESKKKESKYLGKYVNVLEFFDINLVFLSVNSGRITVASFISAIGVTGGLITSWKLHGMIALNIV